MRIRRDNICRVTVRECLTGGFLRAVSHKFSVPYQFLFQERVELHAGGLRSEKEYLLGFLSVTPFNDSFQHQQPCMY